VALFTTDWEFATKIDARSHPHKSALNIQQENGDLIYLTPLIPLNFEDFRYIGAKVLITAREIPDLLVSNDGGISEIASLYGFDSSRLCDISKDLVFAFGASAF
jgi:hypothetical protein